MNRESPGFSCGVLSKGGGYFFLRLMMIIASFTKPMITKQNPKKSCQYIIISSPPFD